MPRYDYRCTACSDLIEVVHGMNEVGPEHCDKCGGAMRKALSAPAIHFKGSGWAKKDARSAAVAAQKKTAGKSEGDSATAASSSGKEKTDAAAGTSSNGAGDASSDSGTSGSSASDKATSKPSASAATSSANSDPG